MQVRAGQRPGGACPSGSSDVRHRRRARITDRQRRVQPQPSPSRIRLLGGPVHGSRASIECRPHALVVGLERARRRSVRAHPTRTRTGNWTADRRGRRAIARALSPGGCRRVRAQGRFVPVASAGRDRGCDQKRPAQPAPPRGAAYVLTRRRGASCRLRWRPRTTPRRARGPGAPLDCVSLIDTLKDSDLQPGSPPPFDMVLIEHGDKTSV